MSVLNLDKYSERLEAWADSIGRQDTLHHKSFGFWSLGKYLKGYKGGMNPDSGPVLFGLGVAASGLALKAAASTGDVDVFERLHKSARPLLAAAEGLKAIPMINLVSLVATDMLSTSIKFSAITKLLGGSTLKEL